MDFGDLLRRSWNIIWNNKFMFVLGFLAALGSGNGGGGGGGNAQFDVGSGGVSPDFGREVVQFIERFGGLIIGLICFFFILAIVFWLIRLTAQAGLISSAARIDAGEKVTLGEAFGAGTSMLGRMVGLNVVMYGAFTLLGLIFAGVALATVGTAAMAEFGGASQADLEAIFGSFGIIGICFACLACLMIPLYILITAVYPFAQRGLVLHKLGVIDSIRHGWQILKDNLADIIMLIILFVVLGIVFGFLVIVVLLPLAVLALGPGVISMISRGSIQVLDVLLLVGGGICLGLVGAAINSIIVSFRSTAVTLAYQEFVARKV